MTSGPYHYSKPVGRMLLVGLEEIVGRAGLNAVLHTAKLTDLIRVEPQVDLSRDFSFAEVSGIQVALETLYGPHGGRGVALRAGRACFKYTLREFGAQLGLAAMDFRLLPLVDKLSTTVKRLAELFNRLSDQRIRVEDQTDSILWQIERCPFCWGRRTSEPVCQLAVGLLEEAAYWASGGKYFAVGESRCVAQGDEVCMITIRKQPVE